jgi:hypothetical protein
VAVAVPAPSDGPAGWPTGETQIRATAEPALNRWAAELLGDPRRIRADVSWVDTEGDVVASAVLRLDALAIGPLDVVAMVGETGEPRPELTELLEEVAAAERPDGVSTECVPRIGLSRDAGWDDDERSLAEAFEVARAAAAVIFAARPLVPADLGLAGEPGAAVIDVDELGDRADAVVAAATAAHARLTSATDNEARRIARSLGLAGVAADELRRRLDAVAALGDTRQVPRWRSSPTTTERASRACSGRTSPCFPG